VINYCNQPLHDFSQSGPSLHPIAHLHYCAEVHFVSTLLIKKSMKMLSMCLILSGASLSKFNGAAVLQCSKPSRTS